MLPHQQKVETLLVLSFSFLALVVVTTTSTSIRRPSNDNEGVSNAILKNKNTDNNKDKVVISLFYESLCPDCIEFDNQQLYPLYAKIPKYIDIDLVPYGNAERKKNPDGSYSFRCQHGKDECYGNKLHACALDKLPHTTGLHFVGCTMSSKKPAAAGPKCAKSLNLTDSQWTEIKSCTEGKQGDDLMWANGERTDQLKPPHQYVPWLLFNGVHSDQDDNDSQTDLLGVVCRHLEGSSSLPEECNQVSHFKK